MALVLKATGTRGGMVADAEELRRGLELLADPDAGCEIMALPLGFSAVKAGRDVDGLIGAAQEMPGCQGLYLRLNPVLAGLRQAARKDDILKRRWLFIDVDPLKAEGHENESATDAEKADARNLADSVRSYLSGCEFPAPIVMDSGNGWALFYRVDLPNDAGAQAILKRLLYDLAERFKDQAGIIDKSVHNATRLCKLPGTWAKKGTPTDDRPHRVARIIYAPTTPEVVPAERIAAAAGIPKAFVAPQQNGHPGLKLRAPAKGTKAYGKRALENECARVATAQPGAAEGRNNALNTAAFCLGQLVAGKVLEQGEVESALYRTAIAAGLEDGETIATIRSGMTAGMQEARTPKPKDEPGQQPSTPAAAAVPEGEPIIIRASQVTTRKVEWLWPYRLALGKLGTFAGIGGLGKTFVLCDITARVTKGLQWPDGSPGCEPGEVLFISGEDDPDDTLVPRLIEMGADLERVAFLRTEVLNRFTLADLETLDKAIGQVGPNVRLVAIDPPTAYLGGVDDHKNAELRSLLSPLANWSRQHRIATLFNTHVNKGSGGKVEAIMRVMGSVAWVNAVRCGHIFAKDPDDHGKRLFVPMKNNLGKEQKGLAFRIVATEGELAKVEWQGEVETTADQAMNQTAKAERRDIAAKQWLIERFAERREWTSSDLFRAAKEANVSRNAVYEAKKLLDLPSARKVTRENGDVEYIWWVPVVWKHLPPSTGTPGIPGTPDEEPF